MASKFPKAAALIKESPFIHAIKKAHFYMNGYNQFGLYYHDIWREDAPILEAVRRMPKEAQDARHLRLHRAIMTDTRREILPMSEWTTYEDNLENGSYLTPYLEQLKKEQKEMKYWLDQ